MKPTALPALALSLATLAPIAHAQAQVDGSVDVAGATIAYTDVGEGEPVLLLHGFGESRATWDPIVETLSRNYRLIVPDLRGHGESTNPLGYFAHDDAAADMIGLLDALGIDRTRAVGFSSGAVTLLHAATGYGDRLSAMVLVGAAPYLPESARAVMRSIDPESMPMESLDAMGLVHGDTAQARVLVRQFTSFADGYTDVNFTPPLLSSITVPTLVVHGDRDALFPVDLSLEVYRALADASLMVFPNMDHRPFPADAEGRRYFTETVVRFLDGPG